TVVVNSPTAITGVSISDVDAGGGALQVTLTAGSGILSLGTTAGLNFTAGDGSADGTMTFSGTLASINNALAGLTYRGQPAASAADRVRIDVDDLGNPGPGGNLTASANVPLQPNFSTVQLVPDPFKAGTMALVIVGTAGNDTITVNPGLGTNVFAVSVNGG